MDQVVGQIMFYSRKGAFEEQLRFLEANFDLIKKSINQVVPAMQSLLPEGRRHTMGLCYLLYARSLVPDKGLVELCEHFFSLYDPAQIRNYCADRFAFIVHRYAELCRVLKINARGIRQLLQLTLGFRPNFESLTPIHCDVVMLCLLERNYSAARRLLDDTILEINPNVTGVQPRDYLLYYYYGGMVWIGLKQWDKAYEFLQTCLTTPCAITLNAIMVEAFKKFVFVSLISRGKFNAVPRQCSGVVQRSMKKFCQEYVDLANAYGKRENEKITKVITEHRAVFAADRHLGLLGQVQSAYVRQAIQRLTATYVTLSLTDIVKVVGVESEAKVETLLLEMTERGELKACINKAQGMVSFIDSDADEAVAALETEMVNVRRTIERLKTMEEAVVVSTEFQMRQIYKDPTARKDILEIEEKIRKNKSLLSKVQDMMQ
jgi:COP9 signalosome complex subunit 3